MFVGYYNKKTHTLSLPFKFNSLLKDLPVGTKIIIFENNCNINQYFNFNQEVV